MCRTLSYLRAFAASGAFAAPGALSYQAIHCPLLHQQNSVRMHGGHRTEDTVPRSSCSHPSTCNGLVENQDVWGSCLGRVLSRASDACHAQLPQTL
ncbi:hypothetical protein C8R44DRAFT_762608, partial [Mycena epipterygia]